MINLPGFHKFEPVFKICFSVLSIVGAKFAGEDIKLDKYLPQKLTSTTMAREVGTVLRLHTLSKDI